MGQYWKVVNLDKKEWVNPHKLGAGLKLGEQLCSYPSSGAALIILCAAQREQRGGGDLDLRENWHGMTPAPMTEEYEAVASRTIGRWAGDRIALVGDYAEDGDLPAEFKAGSIYELCEENGCGCWKDVSEDVCQVIEHELHGKFEGDGWRRFRESVTTNG